MVKRIKHTRDEIRELAIEAAKLRILAHGIQGVKARLIANDIGYAVGTLYQLFKNMDLLILAVNTQTLQALEKQVLTAISKAGNAGVQIAAMTYVDFALQNTKCWQAIFEHQTGPNTIIPQAYLEQQSRLFTILETAFAKHHPNKSTKEVTLEAKALWAGVHGVCILALSNRLDDGTTPLEDVAEVLINTFLNARGNP
ncbi:MAG: TetR-like C-terminal domain-containing protein [Ghiorsea sp.]